MTEDELKHTLSEQAARLGRIEQFLGLDSTIHSPEEKKLPPEQPVTPPAAIPPTLDVEPRQPATLSESPPTQSINEHTVKQTARFEQMIAERWMAWVGAIVTVMAVGFFIKLAYDMGWWGHLPPLAKCLIAAGFGVLLLCTGEYILRKVGRMAAVGLFGAGLGTLYLTAYATFRFFQLLEENGAFWLMLLVAVLGFGITVRARLVAIGVLSLIGGYLSPILLAEAETFPAALPTYLTMLLTVALVLSLTKSDWFRLLRYVGLVLHAILATLWLHKEGTEHWLLAMSFITLWWMLVTGETLLAALRGQSPHGNAIASLFTTIWYAAAGCGILVVANPGDRNWLGLFTAVVACACTFIALPFGPGLTVLSRMPRRAMERLTVTLWAEVGILIAAAIGLQFREQGQSFGQTIGWLVMGVACIEVGRRLPSRGVDWFGLLVGALGVSRVWKIDHSLGILRTSIWTYGDVSMTYWSLLALGSVLATFLAALRLRQHGTSGRQPRVTSAVLLTIIGTLQWMALCVAQCDALALTGGWLLCAGLLLAAAPIGQRQRYVPIALFVLTATAAKWLVFDAMIPRLQPNWDPTATTLVVNWQMGLALAISCCAYWTYCRLLPKTVVDTDASSQPDQTTSTRAQIPIVAGVLLVLVALSFEVDRLISRAELIQTAKAVRTWLPLQERALWWTLLWAVGGLATLVGGCVARLRELFNAGWVLVVAAVLAWLSADTLSWRLQHGVVPCRVALNLQFVVGITLLAILAVAIWNSRRPPVPDAPGYSTIKPTITLAGGLIMAIGLWLGSLEIDRFFAPESARVSNPAMACQTGLSIYWGLYGIALVALGFRRRSAPTRYAGLGLLILALLKVLVVDLKEVDYIYRVLSLLGVGLFLLGTSLAYSKLTTLLDESNETPRAT